ncbi:cellulose binding domain-containing protein, partial [Singulisphaera rosea]
MANSRESRSGRRVSGRKRSVVPAWDRLEERLALSGVGDGLPVVAYSAVNDWGSGLQGQVTITNDEATPLKDWTLSFDYPRQIANLWNASIVSHTGSHYVLNNAGFNATIGAGQAVSIGFVAGAGSSGDRPTNFV